MSDGSLTSSERDLVLHDLGMLLEALGLGDYARPDTPHEVMLQCIAEAHRLKLLERDMQRLVRPVSVTRS